MLRTAICLATAVPCLADVLNVRGPSSDYSQISTAVDAAAEGDVIRIWPGNYKGFTIDDKSLTLVRAKDSGNILVKGTCRIENLSAGRSAVASDRAMRDRYHRVRAEPNARRRAACREGEEEEELLHGRRAAHRRPCPFLDSPRSWTLTEEGISACLLTRCPAEGLRSRSAGPGKAR